MKFEDIFRVNLSKCWKKKYACLECKNLSVCGKIIGYENKQWEYYPF